MFVNNVWTKQKGDAKYKLVDIKDQAKCQEHLTLILLLFDANNALGESQLNHTFYDKLSLQ